MKYLASLLICMAFTPNLSAQEKCILKVEVNNIRSNMGSVHVALSENADTFLEEEWRFESVPVNGKEIITVVFDDLPEGTYGISVFHDENDNGELDTNFVGIPKEPFGFGNDSMGAFGPPSFKKASVEVSPGTTETSVKLKSF